MFQIQKDVITGDLFRIQDIVTTVVMSVCSVGVTEMKVLY